MNRLIRTWIVLVVNLGIIATYLLASYHNHRCALNELEHCSPQPPSMRSPATPRPDEAPVLMPRRTIQEEAPHQSKQLLYLITTTYHKDTQKADLTALCHTLKHVKSLLWIIVENSATQSSMIKAVLGRCNISAVHLTVPNPETVKSTLKYSPKVTGVQHRNEGLKWVREHCTSPHKQCEGVVYFGDDDDRYDLRFFEEIRETKKASVFMVGLTGGLKMEGPYCVNGTVARWHRASGYSREIPVDMQGFAVNVRVLLEQKDVWMESIGAYNDLGYPEANRFLSRFATRTTLECRTHKNEVLVWRARSSIPVTWNEKRDKSDRSIEF